MIAPSPWTLPSHASMFTGMLPSAHTVHESLGTYVGGMRRISRQVLSESRTNIISRLKSIGYSIYGASANPWISPAFGFEFDEFFGVDPTVAEQPAPLWDSPSVMRSAYNLARAGSFSSLLELSRRKATDSVFGLLGRQQMEKGSAAIIEHLTQGELNQPFFLFVNFMEAHEPYRFGEDVRKLLPCYLGQPVKLGWWKEAYPIHANLAITRGVQFLKEVAKFNPVVIVTSDHGQLLGENGRFGHGYFLDEPLLRVPFYMRVPSPRLQPKRHGDFISLTEVYKVIDAVANGEAPVLGSDYALSESFGCHRNLSWLGSESSLQQVYMHRTHILTGRGSLVFNRSSELVEQTSGNFSEEEISSLVNIIKETRETTVAQGDSRVLDNDEATISSHLRGWGYE
jgi:arylsulfatase A-like enzyme